MFHTNAARWMRVEHAEKLTSDMKNDDCGARAMVADRAASWLLGSREA